MRLLLAALGFAAFVVLVDTTWAEQFPRTAAPAITVTAGLSVTPAASAGLAESAAVGEMLRGEGGHVRRWTRRPGLVVITSVLRFEGGLKKDYVATGDTVPDAEAIEMARDLEQGLQVLTGSVYGGFESVRFERPPAGQRTAVMRDGAIVVGRFVGITEVLKAVGYGGRLARADGSISSGTVMLDSDYDRTNALRRLLRIHELGHALGFNHVTSQPSVMNPTLGSEPTDFDRRVASIAFGG